MRAVSLLLLAVCSSLTLGAQQTLQKVRAAGVLTCGVIAEDAEYNTEDDHGSRGGFDLDLCKAVAVAALGEKAQTKVITFLDDKSGVDALIAGKIDLIATLSADFSHTTNASLGESAPVLYDGVGFLVLRKSGIAHAADLTHRKVCFLAETNVETALQAWFTRQHLDLLPFPFQEEGEMEAAYITKNCAAIAGDLTRLAQTRASFETQAPDHMILPEVIAADPLAFAYRSSDPQWGRIVDWTAQVLFHGEALGVTSANIDISAKSADPAVRHLLGATHAVGTPLGLSEDWAASVLRSVGNYREVFDRTFGEASTLSLTRGRNRLTSEGGLILPLPLK
ncbi:transporter substrate-binding domain-containing protein [Terriglobus saanensis]|uniref:Extracellular solute-binding protein family 3 n=1 Tax=Terriglobus saanensis (strain ATCC BAA-1853 / DSM 23119 / SP1PR4) TaxID=401053 RepID=E8V422_TERSS|nr:transporter substrate-binding domain-containing protein [Terriglobus saanensis]ADV82513.1 extracellular solute-binding protein family 3 [Terriglobus saanensis SP1PR4]